MIRTIGVIFTILGLIASFYTGIQVINDSDSFSFFGFDVVVSKADYTPFIISLAVLIVGIILWSNARR